MIYPWSIGKTIDEKPRVCKHHENTIKKNDGQQFHQYEEKEQSPLTSKYLTSEKTTTYDLGNPKPDLEQAQQCLLNFCWSNLVYKFTDHISMVTLYRYSRELSFT